MCADTDTFLACVMFVSFVLCSFQLIGGNTTATDAAFLAEYFHANGIKTSVVGVPCTISGGMKNNFVVSCFCSFFFVLC